MNFRVIFQNLGRVSLVVGICMLLPTLVAIMFGEACWWALAVTVAIAVAVGVILILFCKPKNQVIFSKEGLIIVALTWIWVSLVGCLPFVLSGEIPSFVDALFETISGFSTTGASILTGQQIEGLSKGLQFWRSFTHWIGGMGVIVFVMALASGETNRSMHILRAEMPGPTVDKLVPRARSTAKILYLLYIGLTVLEIILLILGGMPIFDSVVHAFGTAGTGGFGIKADSIAGYNAFCQWIITIFMILFGVNFNLFYLMILRKFRTAFSSRELHVYLAFIVASATIISVNVFNQFSYTSNVADSIRHGVFQAASFITTTGYTTIPASSSIDKWPLLSKAVLFILMFVGSCGGSTGGGLKVSRIVILGYAIRKELQRVLHPRRTNAVKLGGQVVTNETLHSVTSYFGLYMFIFLATFLVLCFDKCPNLTMESNITAAASCLNNIGPAFGVVSGGYFMYSNVSKLVLSLAMLFGRLEIYPILLCLAPSTWTKK